MLMLSLVVQLEAADPEVRTIYRNKSNKNLKSLLIVTPPDVLHCKQMFMNNSLDKFSQYRIVNLHHIYFLDVFHLFRFVEI